MQAPAGSLHHAMGRGAPAAAGAMTPCALNATPAAALLREEDERRNASASAGAAEQCGSVSVAFPLTMMLAGVAGNGLALLLVYGAYQRKENRRRRSFLLCIGSLALTDLAGQLLTSPVVIAVYLAGRDWELLDPSRRLCAFFGFCMTAFGLCPLFTASAMAAERALATRAPHWYSGHMKPGLTRAALLGVWLAAAAFALLPVLGVGVRGYALQWPGTWCFLGPRDGSAFFAAAFALLGLFSLLVTLSCNVATIVALVCRCRARSPASRARRQWGRIATETLLQLLGIMCVLLACWSPLLIMMLKATFNHPSVEQCRGSCNQTRSPELQSECNFFLTAVRLASLNQILDPWVYLLLRKILLRKFCQVANAISCHSKDGWKGRHIMLSDKIRHTAA